MQSPPEPLQTNDTAERLLAVLMGLENQLTDEQKKGPVFFALKKLSPHIVKDFRKIPEDKLKAGISKLASAMLSACNGVAETPDLTQE